MSRLTEELEMGFISPTGEFIPCPFCEHEQTASRLIKRLDRKFYDEMSICSDCTDKLVENFGFILIDGIKEVDVQTPTITTQPQKVELASWLSRNKKYLKYLSLESINNLRQHIDWFDEGLRKEGF